MRTVENVTNKSAFSFITALFFLWGFMTVLNDLLIPYYKAKFVLTDFQSMLVQFAFFGAYGIGAFAYYIYSLRAGDPINKIGYKKGILIGLGLSGAGCFLFFPTSYFDSYYINLLPLFVLGLGFTLLQISCNPYVSILGDPKGASTRLNLAQGFNSLGTTLSPIIGGALILTYLSDTNAIQLPYLIGALLFWGIAIILWCFKLPDYKSEKAMNLTKNALQFAHTRSAMLAIFFYVGAEVAIGSKLIEYIQLPEIAGFSPLNSSYYLGIYWGGAMIGRLTVSVISNRHYGFQKKFVLGLFVSMTTFSLLLLFMTLRVGELNFINLRDTFMSISPILLFIGLQFILMLIFKNSSSKMLTVFSFVVIILLITAFYVKGTVAFWCILSIGLFNSIMWSNIFTLGIRDLKEYTSQASSLLIIMIVGGAILPLFMGVISDYKGLVAAYLFPIISYLYILYFGIYGYKIKHLKNYE